MSSSDTATTCEFSLCNCYLQEQRFTTDTDFRRSQYNQPFDLSHDTVDDMKSTGTRGQIMSLAEIICRVSQCDPPWVLKLI